MRTKLLYLKLARLAWPVVLALSPLALAAGVWLMWRNDPNVRIGMAIDRDQAVTIATQAAAAKGLDTADWESFCRVEHNNSRHFYYRVRRGAEADEVRRHAPDVIVHVLLIAPDGNQTFEADLAADGRVLGYKRRLPGSEVADPGEPAMRALADATLRARPEAASLSASPTMNEESARGGSQRVYSWDWPTTALPEVKRRIIIAVQGKTVVRESVETDFDDAFAKEHLQSSLIGNIAFGVIYGLAMLVIIGFGIYRFAARARQKEISYGRVLLLGLISARVFVFFILQTDAGIYENIRRNPQSPAWAIRLAIIITYLLMGMLIGLAYGSGEGDIREAYPGKLTSLDALLTGRLFSRNVARSVIFGAALGCWTVLLSQAVVLPWAQRPETGWQLVQQLDTFLARLAWLPPLYMWVTFSVLISVTALLLPLPFLTRRLRNRRVIIALTLLNAVGAGSAFSSELRPWLAVLLVSAVFAGTLLVAFFSFDLQTAFFSMGAVPLTSFILYLLAQPAPTIRQAGQIAAAVIIGFIGLQGFFFFRGRLYGEEEVRPLYAHNLAERLFMQAEVTAAREAQIRLAPQTLPRMPQLELAAACEPAREVGGDFYDFFSLDENRLGIFLAEGGGRGLGSALTIAFAKGWLMPKLRNETRGDDSPAEIVRSLQARLSAMIEQDAGFGFVYAVIDPSEGTLRYARIGNYPRVLTMSQSGSAKTRQPEETEIRFYSDHSTDQSITVIEGLTVLEPGDVITLFTSGLSDAWAEDKQTARDGFIRSVVSHSSVSLSDAFNRMMSESYKLARQKGVRDDLTAIMIRLEGLSAETLTVHSGTSETQKQQES
jgi:serine phosphatase RsbU (regulator of sigma subunit)